MGYMKQAAAMRRLLPSDTHCVYVSSAGDTGCFLSTLSCSLACMSPPRRVSGAAVLKTIPGHKNLAEEKSGSGRRPAAEEICQESVLAEERERKPLRGGVEQPYTARPRAWTVTQIQAEDANNGTDDPAGPRRDSQAGHYRSRLLPLVELLDYKT
ncbi:hypothetical protein PAMP_015323 [Pampus punctatissimus]